jgi:hypothetical protein
LILVEQDVSGTHAVRNRSSQALADTPKWQDFSDC